MLMIAILSPALFALIILICCIKNYKKVISKNLRFLSVPIGMIFGTFGYSMRFLYESNDMLSYFSQIDHFSTYNFAEIIARDSEKLYVQDGLFYFVSRCGNNHVLPFIVGTLIYSIIFYILFDLISRSKKKWRVGDVLLLVIVAIGVLSPYTIIGNTRCVLSFVIASFAVYRDTVQKKRNLVTFLLYLIPIWLHPAAIVMIVIRIFSIVFEKFEKIKWLMLLLVFLLPVIIDFSYNSISGLLSGPIGGALSSAIDKAHYYLHWTSGGWATQVEFSTSSKLIKIFGVIFIIIILYLILIGVSRKKSEKTEPLISKPMISFLFLTSIFALGCLSIKTGAFWRFESIVVLFSPVILIQAIEADERYKKYLHALSLCAACLMLYNVIYQTTVLKVDETITNFIFTPGVKILFEILKGSINLIG